MGALGFELQLCLYLCLVTAALFYIAQCTKERGPVTRACSPVWGKHQEGAKIKERKLYLFLAPDFPCPVISRGHLHSTPNATNNKRCFYAQPGPCLLGSPHPKPLVS